MFVEKFKSEKKQKLFDLIQGECYSISYAKFQKLLRNKDVKVNGLRVSENLYLEVGDEIVLYLKEKPNDTLSVCYEDDNIIVVFKPRQIETVSDDERESLLKLVSNKIGQECFAVHRLDRNTQGLVVFAKNQKAKFELDQVFKNRLIDKFYHAWVYGVFDKENYKLDAYLKKDSKKSLVMVSNERLRGYDKITTEFKVLKQNEDDAIILVKLVTGKTHQIRAHMAHIGHFVIGDEKYGISEINKMYKKKFQCLCASKIIFHFKEGVLKYLDGKIIELDKSMIEFL